MSATPTKEPAESSEKKDKYGRQIEQAFESASKLAGSNLPPADFYQEFLNKTLSAIEAPAGAVWLRTPQGFLQIACQVNLEQVGLESRRGGRQCHNEILRQVFQAAPPRPIILEPNGRLAPAPGAPPGQAGPDGGQQVPAANLTDYFALFAPIVTPDRQPFGVLEVFQDTKHDPRMYPTFLNYTFQMAGYASQYHQFSNARAASGMEKTFTQVESFARLIHTTLNPTEVGYHVANEGRKLIECDRLCVGVRHARKKVTVEAVSGADVVEKASTHVRRLRRLMEAVLQWGETLTFKGTKDAGLPPDVSHTLDEYLNESQPKLLIVQPIRDEREKDQTVAARSVLVMESFNPPDLIEPLVQRLDVVGKHAATALYNAAQMKRVPLKPLWWPIAKVQEGVGGKGRFYGITALVVLAALTVAMVFVTYPLRMDAKGQMLPVEIAKIYPPSVGVVKEVRARPGDRIGPDYPAVMMFSDPLTGDFTTLTEKFNDAAGREQAALLSLSTWRGTEAGKFEVQTQYNTSKAARESAGRQLEAMRAAYNLVPNRPGWYEARAPQFDVKLKRPQGTSRWTVLNDDRRESLSGRTMQPQDELLRVGNLEGAWHVELKIPQRNVGQINRALDNPQYHKTEAGGRKYLDVDVLLASMPDTRYLGRLYQDEMAQEAVPNKNEHDENEPVVTAYVKLNLDDIPQDKWVPRGQFTTGLEVRTRIRCGDHALGYSMFHGVWEWFYEKVVFFF